MGEMHQISEAATKDRGEQTRMSSSSSTSPWGGPEQLGGSPALFADRTDLPQFS